MSSRRALALLFVFCFGGCAGAPPTTSLPHDVSDDRITEWILDFVVQSTPALAAPTETADALNATASSMTADARRTLLGRVAIRQMWDAEHATDPTAARRAFTSASRTASTASARSHDRSLLGQMAFVDLWSQWRSNNRRIARAADRFVDQFRDAGALFFAAWIIKGEIALGARQWEDAAAAYRYLLGEPDHALYVLALYRTATCYEWLGRIEDAKQSLRAVDSFGRRPGAGEMALVLAHAARRRLGLPEPVQAEPGASPSPHAFVD